LFVPTVLSFFPRALKTWKHWSRNGGNARNRGIRVSRPPNSRRSSLERRRTTHQAADRSVNSDDVQLEILGIFAGTPDKVVLIATEKQDAVLVY